MEMDVAAVAAACTSTVLASSTTTDQLAQTTTTALTILDKVKKEMTLVAQAAESKKRPVARWVVAGQREKDKKLADERGSGPTSCRRCTLEPPPTLWPSWPPSTPLPCSRARW
jgi:hypothetical protein